MARREDMKQLASSLVWDIRNAAAQDGQLDSALAPRLDALEEKLLADHCQQEPGFYNDNVRYKGQFQLLLKEATAAGEQVRDGTSFLSRTLAQQQDPSWDDGSYGSEKESQVSDTWDPFSLWGLRDLLLHSLCDATKVTPAEEGEEADDAASFKLDDQAAADSNHTSAPTVNIPDNHVPVSSEVSELHSKFTQDPNFKGIRGKFGADKLFAAGIDAIVGPMDVQVYMHVCIRTHKHTNTQIHTQTHTTYICARTHTRTHTLIFENEPRLL